MLRRLALTADVVVENFRPGVMADIGLDPDELRAEKPAIIIASVNGFGSIGPLSQTAGLDRVGIPIIDIDAGVFTAFGIAVAQAGRERTGHGLAVSISLLEAALAISVFPGPRYLSLGEVPTPQGNNHPVLAPYGVFATADIPIIIAVRHDKHRRDLCTLIGDPALADVPHFATGKTRAAHRAALAERLEAALVSRSGIDWVEALRGARIPTGPSYNYA